MVTKEQIARINDLARKQKTSSGLTEEELTEQQNLRQLYLDSVRENLRAQLDNIEFIDDNKKKIEE